MFVVQVTGPWSVKQPGVYLDTRGKRTNFLSKAATFPNQELAETAGLAFMSTGRGLGFSIDPQ